MTALTVLGLVFVYSRFHIVTPDALSKVTLATRRFASVLRE